MVESETQEWWGAAEGEPADASWKTGSDAKRERMARYIEWLLTPADLRNPPSKAKLADELGVHPQTLRNYQKDPVFQRRLMEEGREMARVDRVPDILESLYRQAKDDQNPRSVAAARAFLEHVEKMVPQGDSVENVEQMSNEDLANLAVQLLQRVNGE